MADGHTLSWQGGTYEISRKDGAAATPAPITSFPAEPTDGPDDVREKVLAWLEANADRPTTDVGRQ